MPVVINTNSAATMAASNLADSSQLLQKSLNRLSSGSRIVTPADDAGGLAVSMKLSATAHRQDAVASNVANSSSYLQSQDGALSVVGKVLSRISELKTLSFDPTKNSSDLANYNAEFSQLKNQLTSLAAEKFNGIALFGSTGLTVGVTADSNAGTTVNFGASPLFTSAVSVGMSPSEWSKSDSAIDDAYPLDSGGSLLNAGEITVGFHNSGAATYSTVQSVGSGGFTAAFDTSVNNASSYSPMNITAGGNSVNLTALLSGTANHHVAITDDGVNASISIDGGAATVVGTLGSGAFTFQSGGRGFLDDLHIGHFSLAATGSTNLAGVTGASNLSSLSLSTITSSIQDVATMRANNGAQQSRLGFAAEVLTTNQANIKAANSRITDVDVAAESTQLARYNVLTQAGTAMLSQANQSNQVALRLLG